MVANFSRPYGTLAIFRRAPSTEVLGYYHHVPPGLLTSSATANKVGTLGTLFGMFILNLLKWPSKTSRTEVLTIARPTDLVDPILRN